MKMCPYCAESIQDSAIKCKQCGEWLDTGLVNPEEERKAQKDWKEKREPTTTSPIKMSKKLTVFSNEFEFKGVVYLFTQIEDIYFYWKKNTRVPLGLPSDLGWKCGEDMEIRIKVDSNDNELTSNTWTYEEHGSDKCESFYDGYRYLMKKTFNQRLMIYIKSVEENGFFTYSDTKIYPDGSIIDKKGNSYSIHNRTVTRSPFYITIKQKESAMNIGERVKDKIIGSGITIPTNYNSDVFFYLLKKYFGELFII